MTMAQCVRVLVLAAGLGVVVSCTDDAHDHGSSGVHSSPYPTCDLIIKTCHPVDVEEGPIHDCHNVGHDAKSDADCIPKKDECLRICTAAADGGTPDGGAPADAGDQ